MAFHPFRSFQRNQKIWMAGATLLAIISFLFLGVIIQLVDGGRSGAQQNPTVAESRRFGKITEYDLHRLRNNQSTLQGFLRVLYRNLDQKLEQDGFDAQSRGRALFPLAEYVEQLTRTQSSEYLVNMWLVTQSVQAEGLLPDWDDAKQLLWDLTGGPPPNGFLSDAVYDQTRQDVGLSHEVVKQLLASQIQWRQALMRLNLSIGTVSPATRWDWYQRLFRNVTIEVAAVSTDAFIDQMPEPTERQLTAFFEEHKGKRFNPMIAESGFIMPTELAFQYVVAEPTQQLLDSITEESMLAFYEEHKDEWFRRPTTPMTPLPGMVPGTIPGMPGGAFPSFPTPGRPGTPTTPSLPDLSDLPGLEDILPIPAPNVPEPVEPPVPEEAGEEAIEETSAPETSGAPRVTTRLVSYQTDDVEQANIVTEPVAEGFHERGGWFGDVTMQPNEAIPVGAVETIEEMLTDTSTQVALEEAVEQGRESIEQLEKALEQLEGAIEAMVEQGEADLSILFKPFDEVKDEIREALAQDKAMQALLVIQEKMKEYGDSYHEHFEQGKPIPPMPNLSAFVASQGLKLVTVPMGNVFEAMKTEFARGAQEQQHLAQKFHRLPLLFDGEIFWGADFPILIWVTEEKHELRPESLKEVREVVLQRWKEVEARTLAMKKAEELADEARKLDRSLNEVFGGRRDVPVADTEPFSWMTPGGWDFDPVTGRVGQKPPSFGTVAERGVEPWNAEFGNRVLVAPGWDFMETVYSLQVGETGVVFNQPQTVAYVVRVTSSSPSTDVLWEQFQTTPVSMYYAAGAQEMMISSREAWLDEIRDKAGFRWVNRPDAREWERFDE
ncbi:MAG: hypothetical protein FWE95_02510 [Planctomycetaceae bacterium]|nr:hypothetical protein [Planctomycetaceae bacterium]